MVYLINEANDQLGVYDMNNELHSNVKTFSNHKEAFAYGYSFSNKPGFMGYDTDTHGDGSVTVGIKLKD